MVRATRLRRTRDIDLVRAHGALRSAPMFTLRSRRNASDEVRVAVTAPRAVGTSVARNRARRRVREAVRAELASRADAPGTDLLLSARRAALSAPSQQIREAVRRQLGSAL